VYRLVYERTEGDAKLAAKMARLRVEHEMEQEAKAAQNQTAEAA
jgi:hypothetical protein